MLVPLRASNHVHTLILPSINPPLHLAGFPQSVLYTTRGAFPLGSLHFRLKRRQFSRPVLPSSNMGAWKRRLHGAVSEFFEIEKRHSTVATEVRAGITTFLTMSYILLVNPQILAQVRSRRVGRSRGKRSVCCWNAFVCALCATAASATQSYLHISHSV